MNESDKICGIRKTGTISLEDGMFVVRQGDGHLIGRILVGIDGLYFDGIEPIACQKGDPAKWRGAGRYEDGKGGGVVISGNRLRDDDRMEENGYLTIGSLDNPEADDRGMAKLMLRKSRDANDMGVAFVATTQYSEERFGGRTIWTGLRNFVGGLWKYAGSLDGPSSTAPDPAPVPETPHTPAHELRHPDGVFWLVIQDDGNIVAYRNRVAFDYGTGVPYWNSGTVDPPV